MAMLNVRLPDSLHHQLEDLAKKEKVSVDRLVCEVIAQRLSALTEEDYLERLAREGSREAFERVFAKVPDIEPDPWDRWEDPA
jgi:predicted transcriptional regulator